MRTRCAWPPRLCCRPPSAFAATLPVTQAHAHPVDPPPADPESADEDRTSVAFSPHGEEGGVQREACRLGQAASVLCVADARRHATNAENRSSA